MRGSMAARITLQLPSFSSLFVRRIKSSTFAFLALFKSARRPSRSYRMIGTHPLPTLYEINHPRMREIRREGDQRRTERGLSRTRVIIAERMRDRSILRSEADKPRSPSQRAPLCRASVARQFPIPLLARRTRDKEIATIGSERESVLRRGTIVHVLVFSPCDKIPAL